MIDLFFIIIKKETFFYGALGCFFYEIMRFRNIYLRKEKIPRKELILFSFSFAFVTVFVSGLICAALKIETPLASIALGYSMPTGTLFSLKSIKNQLNNFEGFEETSLDEMTTPSRFEIFVYKTRKYVKRYYFDLGC
jgi:hypothetical protein